MKIPLHAIFNKLGLDQLNESNKDEFVKQLNKEIAELKKEDSEESPFEW